MLTGMLPQENFLNLTLWDGFWGYFGAQNITTNFCFSYGMVTAFWFTSRLHAWRRVTISGFQASWEWHEGATQARKPVRLLLIPCNTGRECVATALKICSFSGLISSLLRLDLDIRAGRLLACKQRVATLSQSKHCSGDCRVCLFSMIQCWLDQRKRSTLSAALVSWKVCIECMQFLDAGI